MKIVSFALFLFFYTSIATAQSIWLDKTFGGTGEVIASVDTSVEVGVCLGIQSDGKIIEGGYSSANGNDYRCDFALIRYNYDGSVDKSFGTDGRTVIRTELDKRANGIYGMKQLIIRSDDKILAVGSRSINFTDEAIAIQFEKDGTLDYFFADKGILLLTPTRTSRFLSVAIDREERILCTGTPTVEGSTFIVRFNRYGYRDKTYGNDGFASTLVDAKTYAGNSCAVLYDGKLVVGGTYNLSTGPFVAVRYTADGQIDSTFGHNGRISIAEGFVMNKILITNNGKLIFVGTANYPNNNSQLVIVRCNSDGSRDSSFATNGVAAFTFKENSDLANFAAALQSDGKIIAVADGDYNPKGSSRIIARITTDGMLDSTFGTGGYIGTDFGASTRYAPSVAIQPNGRILVGGAVHSGKSNFAISRYYSDLSQDVRQSPTTDQKCSVYPNPITDASTVVYMLDQASSVKIKLIDELGRCVQVLYESKVESQGTHEQRLIISSNMSHGIYRLQLETNTGITSINLLK